MPQCSFSSAITVVSYLVHFTMGARKNFDLLCNACFGNPRHLCSIMRSLIARRASQKVTQIFSEELCDISSWLITGKVETGEKQQHICHWGSSKSVFSEEQYKTLRRKKYLLENIQ